MVSSISNRITPQRNVTRPLLNAWKNAIDALDRNDKKAGVGQESTPAVAIQKPKEKVVPHGLLNRYEVAALALNHFNNAANPNFGLWQNLNRDRLSLASQLADQGIYV